MLRLAVIVFAVVLVLAGVGGSVFGEAGTFPVTIWGLILLAAVLFERWRYGRGNAASGSEWQETDERFIDPETGRLTQVLYNARTGDRSYRVVAENGAVPKA